MDLFRWKNKPSKEANVVVDLDRMLSTSVSFQFGGKAYEIKPLTTAEFLVATQRLGNMDALREKKKITDEELVDAYADFFGSMCKDINKKIVRRMTPSQVAALFQLMVDCMSGKAYAEDEKKKTMTQKLH